MKNHLAPWEKLREDTLCLARAHVEKALERRPDALPLEQAIPLLRSMMAHGETPAERRKRERYQEVRAARAKAERAVENLRGALGHLDELGDPGAGDARELAGIELVSLRPLMHAELEVPSDEHPIKAAVHEMWPWLGDEGGKSAKIRLWDERRTIEMWWGAKAMPRDVAVAVVLADAFPPKSRWIEHARAVHSASYVLAWISQLVSSELSQTRRIPK